MSADLRRDAAPDAAAADFDFDGRVAIVTGAGQGMGREHALMLASRGARVVVNDLNAANAEQVVAEITARGGVAAVDTNNVVSGAEHIVATAVQSYGRLDIVVNNAGINAFGRFWEMDSALWWRIFDVAVKGVVEVSRAAMPHLIASGSGRLINISSNGVMGVPLDSAYNAAKAAIWGLGLTLAEEAREVGVQVTTLMPVAWTPMTENAFPNPVIQDAMRRTVPASAVSAFVAFLAHQDTTVFGDTFEIAGTAAGRIAISGRPRVRVEAPTPESWARHSEDLGVGGELRAFRNASESFRDQMVFLAPELDAVLPADAADVSR
ncbi:SDR family NAD(P)-dependent oxidoreductase [Pseudoclavibacter sp. RFBA6]|uniref:SDR family NAD(P)-dependent oxidoreductase n=1 Tax=Pseudoclavibacter sp. RFBA6 TaxID=2080573 RepID=UPI0015E1C8F7|nr:SDR family NAD(P)-dependent oxidoreductase [Pseudoclavibacter sp. RFBA6]